MSGPVVDDVEPDGRVGDPRHGPHCTSCGSVSCIGCSRTLDPPRFCAACGRRLTVAVSPGGYRARCRDHGEFVADQG